jgi:A/G-specific adenine glycosylase
MLQGQDGLLSLTVPMFQQLIWDYYKDHGRLFPWRQTDDPYHILVSEIMLQQTQTSRVIKKYEFFISTFPDFKTLAESPLIDVLRAWQGLGYNRRAVALHKIAQIVVADYKGELPSSEKALIQLPGIGPYTVSAIKAIAFNQPAVLIETNIRTVYIFFFFPNQETVTDKEIIPLVTATLDITNPREWYYALFDYGAMLKRRVKLNERSAHFHQQSVFKGSNREMRSNILRRLLLESPLSMEKLIEEIQGNSTQIKSNVEQLWKEGFLSVNSNMISIQ